jgi:hypothetical protein
MTITKRLAVPADSWNLSYAAIVRKVCTAVPARFR